MSREIREAQLGDAEAIAAIHDEAVLAGNATFRTEPRPLSRVEEILRGDDPFLVAVDDGVVVGWASAGPYEESNPYYRGVREVGIYVGAKARGGGVGGALLGELAKVTAEAGVFKLVAKVFDTNAISLRLFERAGYEKVGTHVRHGRLHGEWKDVVVLEKPLEP